MFIIDFCEKDKSMEENKNGIWEELKDAFRYLFQSAKGKYSLESYLEALGEFTDEEINRELDDGEHYGGGEVTFSSIRNKDYIKIVIEMRFSNERDMKIKTKRAEREVERRSFTDSALKIFDENGETTFEIKPPRRM